MVSPPKECQVLTVEIVLLAMVALFVGLRLYAVLGQRTGHEQQPVTRTEPPAKPEAAAPAADSPLDKVTAAGLRQLIAADPSFDTARFLDGAQAAYRMILEAFWRGDRETLADLVDADVRTAFETAIAEREAAGHVLDNRLIGIDKASIESARIDKKVATVEVRFEAHVAAVTRNAEGEVIAGSLTDAVGSNDIWTFRRNLASDDPNWLLVETDEAEA
jgi:predicted lipid-binding transport protein (Tim44 family)